MTTVLQRIAPILEVTRVTDGDTYWARPDLGYHEHPLKEYRLDGYDTPETQTRTRRQVSAYERERAAEARRLANVWMAAAVAAAGVTLYVRSKPDPERWNRWLGDFWIESDGDQWPERHLGAELRSEGLASLWPTRWYEEFDHTL